MEVIVALVTGLFGGIGGVVLWERLLRPGLDRRQIAAVLAVEIELNEERLLVTQSLRTGDPSQILRNLHMSTVALESYRNRLAALNPEVLRLILRLYWDLERAQSAAHSASDQYEVYSKALPHTPEKAKRNRMIKEALSVLDDCVSQALRTSEQLREVLYPLAKIKPTDRLTRDELEARVKEGTGARLPAGLSE